MRIRVDDIHEEGIALDSSEAAEDFPLLAEMIEAGEVAFAAAVRTRIRVVRVRGMVEAEGEVRTTMRFACSACLQEFEAPVASSFALTFVRELPQVSDESGEEVQLSAEEMGMIPFHGEEIDLHDAVAEQIVMTLPIRPLCRELCKGLCPQCGADRNEGECGCVRPVMNNKFAALKDFRVDEKKQ